MRLQRASEKSHEENVMSFFEGEDEISLNRRGSFSFTSAWNEVFRSSHRDGGTRQLTRSVLSILNTG